MTILPISMLTINFAIFLTILKSFSNMINKTRVKGKNSDDKKQKAYPLLLQL